MNRILLVDDEKWVRSALKWTVEKTCLPFNVVHECANGLEALDWLRGNQADLVLTDIGMPVMDGITLVNELHRKSCSPDVVIISVYDDFPFVQKALRNGVRDYLLKPVQPEEMHQCLTKWLEERKPADGPIPVQADAATGSPIIQKVLHYIETTPPSLITLTEAAKSIPMNACYLSQLFKQEMNVNFVDYVTEIKITEAKRLLTATSLRISEVAERLGYADIAYFSNTFKKVTGVSPSEYRNKDKH
ncbi:response regulator [Acetonema longum]|uniref:AraC family transcriptional regulator n=1 Tax=Acetonema longum DSM 6540 TaxID=1009370 RepID=F7NJ97_9FIRM|nr:response regulator [Acetonema longum]EGO63845.1 AraC family transcriptional regulator [Acetonema longum DSM 6540]